MSQPAPGKPAASPAGSTPTPLLFLSWVVPFLLLGCGPTGTTEGARLAQTASATATASVSALPPPAPVATTPPASSASAPDAGALEGCEAARARDELDEALLDRLVFRQITVGLIDAPRRLTWVLSRAQGRARLHLLCQPGVTRNGERGNRVNGSENDESVWAAPVLTVYAGRQTGQTPLSYRLDAVSGSTGDDDCARPPQALILSCHPGSVTVLAAGSVLEGKGRWRPAGAQRVAGLLCEMTNEDGDKSAWAYPFKMLSSDWPLVFAPRRGDSAGIEWAFENSDTVVQEGAYRFLPKPNEAAAAPPPTRP